MRCIYSTLSRVFCYCCCFLLLFIFFSVAPVSGVSCKRQMRINVAGVYLWWLLLLSFCVCSNGFSLFNRLFCFCLFGFCCRLKWKQIETINPLRTEKIQLVNSPLAFNLLNCFILYFVIFRAFGIVVFFGSLLIELCAHTECYLNLLCFPSTAPILIFEWYTELLDRFVRTTIFGIIFYLNEASCGLIVTLQFNYCWII